MSSLEQLTAEQDQSIAQAMERDGGRLRNYIRKHVVDLEAAEDILQEVFVELVEAYRLLKPIEQVSALAVPGRKEPHHRSLSWPQARVAEPA